MRKVPHACPVCHGTQRVPAGFYTVAGSSTSPEPCRSCDQTGIVWCFESGGLLPITPAGKIEWPPGLAEAGPAQQPFYK